jgi:putative ABC transport system substrate-binding protein
MNDRLMDRRAFISTVALGPLAVPRVVLAQPARNIYRIGYLGSSPPASELAGPQPSNPNMAALLRGLRELGYVYGQHFVTEVRSGEGKLERFPGLASELVRLKVDLIVTSGPMLPAVKQATSTIPVVMIGAADPVAQGVAQSLGRPGGNFTGFSIQLVETTAKRLELLKELAPGAASVAVLWDPRSGPPLSWRAAESAARERGWKLLSLEIKDPGEIEGAFKAAAAARAGAVLVLPSAVLDKQAHRIAELATKNRLPAVYGLRWYVEAGGLMSYSPDLIDLFRRAAVVVDKILKGARPGDLPFEQPTKFELVINLKAARSIGLAIPQSILARADEVIR